MTDARIAVTALGALAIPTSEVGMCTTYCQMFDVMIDSPAPPRLKPIPATTAARNAGCASIRSGKTGWAEREDTTTKAATPTRPTTAGTQNAGAVSPSPAWLTPRSSPVTPTAMRRFATRLNRVPGTVATRGRTRSAIGKRITESAGSSRYAARQSHWASGPASTMSTSGPIVPTIVKVASAGPRSRSGTASRTMPNAAANVAPSAIPVIALPRK